MRHSALTEKYFGWLCDQVCDGWRSGQTSFFKLLRYLHNREFTWTLDKDENRAEDGRDLRRRFAMETGYNFCDISEFLSGPCSVLEMMIGLAVRCEETIMDDPNYGNRTKYWFWKMVTNLGLGAMYDSQFDDRFVGDVISRFLDREYEPDGKGSLFYIRDCAYDLRDVEIWYQLCWFLDTII